VSICRFVTEAYVVHLATHLCGMNDVTGVPADADRLTTDADKATFFSQLSRRIVSEVWQMPSITHIKDALECKVADDYVADQWRLCSQGNDSDLQRLVSDRF